MRAEQEAVAADKPRRCGRSNALGLAADLAWLLPCQSKADADPWREGLERGDRFPIRRRKQGLAVNALPPHQLTPVEILQSVGDPVGGTRRIRLDGSMRVEQNPARRAGETHQHDADETQDEMNQQPHGPDPRADKPSS